jgi:hypothetical protein
MIDNPEQVERLIARLTAALPLAANVTPELAATIRAQSPSFDAPRRCSITWVSYIGDEGGILCKLDLGREESAKAFFVSITHLAFDPRAPLAREIVAYQKHRIKRLRRLGNPASSDLEDHQR